MKVIKWYFIFWLMVAFLLTLFSCRTQKSVLVETKKENKVDSFQYREIATEHKVVVPADTASIEVPYELLLNNGFTYSEKSKGRAKVIIEKKSNGGITITAQCDSLEKILITRDKEIYQLQKQLVDQSKERQVTIVRKLSFIQRLALYFGLVASILLTIQNIHLLTKSSIWLKIITVAKKLLKFLKK